MTEHLRKAWTHRYKVLAAIAVFAAALSLILGLHSGKVCAVMVDDKTIAYAESKGAVKKAIEKLSAQKSTALGQEVSADSGLKLKVIETTRIPVSDNKLDQILDEKIDFFTRGVVLKINDKPQLNFKNRKMASDFLDRLKDKYRQGENCEITLAEKVEIVDARINIKNLNSIPEALLFAEKGKGEPEIHIVEENDTLWGLAIAHNTTVEKLTELNPGITEDLQLGQEIKVSGSAPLLTVIATCEITREETIPYQTEYQNDSSLPMGTRKTVQKGKEGSKTVTYQVTTQNGVETEKKIVNEDIAMEPVPMIVKKGTKFVLSSRGGSLVWPVNGRVSSPFGSRSRGFHNGVDLASSYGNPVYASGPGTVSSAGWGGGYGKMVVISHGNGVQTRYAHLSSISVRSGQSVSRGQLIGRVGSTGNSTGPHLHFEVIVNGTPRNPLNYL